MEFIYFLLFLGLIAIVGLIWVRIQIHKENMKESNKANK